MVRIDRANTNSLWCSVLVETLFRCGLKHVIISPGSRSTPLTMAFALHSEIEAIPVLDERSAGFFALGLAKQSHRPVALVCTSGTAAVNFFPAVVEASESRIPLLVLTADRPPELRDCGAGQTIDQIRLYGNYPVFQEEMALPSVGFSEISQMKAGLFKAYQEALRGPVHLNCPFRDPLPPIADGSTEKAPQIDDQFFDDLHPVEPTSASLPVPITIQSSRGIIIAGTAAPEDPEAYCSGVAALSRASGWPVLADGLSPVRNYASLQDRLVTGYDFILRNDSLVETLEPEVVIALGPLPTSKRLRQWLTDCPCSLYHVHETGKNLDPTGSVVQVVSVPVPDGIKAFNFHNPGDAEYSRFWLQAQGKVESGLEAEITSMEQNRFEGWVASRLPALLPEGTPLFIASSMPVRDVEYFWPPNDQHHQIHSSRGVNGIDGTLSTALGIAHCNRPAVLLTGDLAFLHDSNGLLIRPEFEGHLTVLLVNNHGGGIFNHLPVSRFEPPFARYFGTPQEVDFQKLAEATGCSYIKLEAFGNLEGLLNPLPDEGIRIIEIETDRHLDAECRERLFKKLCSAL
ncbi:MAG: 2-succinyl-5-enolpyruvyl-6-hydroxy-3-cyclohexene-1-carboxylic-acid synthase [Verrucomicrobiae bacterium]|nr:2-succinyl-5-enolpyruvyl-6-hydroxy-3-cyclohexene-1-carboxylic-acid synthase [Verrucomicrobiae bacterium]